MVICFSFDVTEAAVSSEESDGASGNGTADASMMVPTKSNYDAIFNVRVVCGGGDVVVHTPNLVLTI